MPVLKDLPLTCWACRSFRSCRISSFSFLNQTYMYFWVKETVFWSRGDERHMWVHACYLWIPSFPLSQPFSLTSGPVSYSNSKPTERPTAKSLPPTSSPAPIVVPVNDCPRSSCFPLEDFYFTNFPKSCIWINRYNKSLISYHSYSIGFGTGRGVGVIRRLVVRD